MILDFHQFLLDISSFLMSDETLEVQKSRRTLREIKHLWMKTETANARETGAKENSGIITLFTLNKGPFAYQKSSEL